MEESGENVSFGLKGLEEKMEVSWRYRCNTPALVQGPDCKSEINDVCSQPSGCFFCSRIVFWTMIS